MDNFSRLRYRRCGKDLLNNDTSNMDEEYEIRSYLTIFAESARFQRFAIFSGKRGEPCRNRDLHWTNNRPKAKPGCCRGSTFRCSAIRAGGNRADCVLAFRLIGFYAVRVFYVQSTNQRLASAQHLAHSRSEPENAAAYPARSVEMNVTDRARAMRIVLNTLWRRNKGALLHGCLKNPLWRVKATLI